MTSSCAESASPTARGRSRTIEITSYAEVVLALALPRTRCIRRSAICLCRPKSSANGTRSSARAGPALSTNRPPWMFHLMAVHGATQREDVLRNGPHAVHRPRPHAVADSTGHGRIPAPLSGSQGSVLDPIVAIRCRITLDPEESVTVDLVSGIGETRDLCLGLVEKYQDRRLADRVFDLAWTHSQVVLRQLNATEADAQLYGRLASSDPLCQCLAAGRAEPLLIKNRRGQSGLWGYAISGDLPIVLLQIADPANIDLVRQLVQAHAYWRLKGLAVDLVIWNEDHAGYRQVLHDQIMGLIAAGVEAHVIDRPGGIFVRTAEQMSNEDRILLQSVARAIITDRRGTLADQITRVDATGRHPRHRFNTDPSASSLNLRRPSRPDRDLIFLTDSADSLPMAGSMSSRRRASM